MLGRRLKEMMSSMFKTHSRSVGKSGAPFLLASNGGTANRIGVYR
ncbi:hypothetical protein GYO_0420 [Bacillus spizizenii TU-B-10]|uniref:Uncharacterized protein n=1 Tax=Bacillus spizizenii (strain DSM 15029 / JCM 12233 / NBRC 101239 / NRRL B-23049 / TU-B-10) TaxID=1052585 RepID=G4NQQ2_BACS4|nr:hypothetical protein GYO_0420 [Bacillus spizizenii TU-B-10]